LRSGCKTRAHAIRTCSVTRSPSFSRSSWRTATGDDFQLVRGVVGDVGQMAAPSILPAIMTAKHFAAQNRAGARWQCRGSLHRASRRIPVAAGEVQVEGAGMGPKAQLVVKLVFDPIQRGEAGAFA
jgi:hypothetical protein